MDRLGTALSAAVAKSTTPHSAILFSGGLDSTVLAFLAKKSGKSSLLITAGMEDSEDIKFAKGIASEIGMKLETRIISPDELRGLYERAAKISGETDFMKIELGLLLLACCETAQKKGIHFLISGTGAEELFLGYKMHAEKHASKENLDELRRTELAGLQAKDLARNEKIAAACGIKLALPYLNEAVVQAALAIPANENFAKGENKAALRNLAREIGVPETACSRPKRAMQYGSGIHGLLLKMRKGKLI